MWAAICGFSNLGILKICTTGTSISLGPPALITPEVWRREEYTDTIDVFSPGQVLLYAFQQDQLYTGAMDQEGGYKTVLEQLASLREHGQIPEKLGALLRSMLSWDPVDRPTAAQALEHEDWKAAVSCDSGPQPQQGSEVSSEGVAGSGSESGRQKRMQRSDGPSVETGHRSAGLSTTAGIATRREKRIRRTDGPSPE